MSRAIQIRVQESVVRTVHVEDGVESPLELLPVLAPERMGELLATELEAHGFVRDKAKPSIVKRTGADGLEVTIDTAAAKVSVKLGATTDLDEQITLDARAVEEAAQRTEASLRGSAVAELDRRVVEKTEALRRKVTRQLEDKVGELRGELDQAVGRVTIAALTERAKQLGEIQELVADDAGNVTIKVKV